MSKLLQRFNARKDHRDKDRIHPQNGIPNTSVSSSIAISDGVNESTSLPSDHETITTKPSRPSNLRNNIHSSSRRSDIQYLSTNSVSGSSETVATASTSSSSTSKRSFILVRFKTTGTKNLRPRAVRQNSPRTVPPSSSLNSSTTISSDHAILSDESIKRVSKNKNEDDYLPGSHNREDIQRSDEETVDLECNNVQLDSLVDEEDDPIVRTVLHQELSVARINDWTVDDREKIEAAIQALDKSANEFFIQGNYPEAFRRYERALILKRRTLTDSIAIVQDEMHPNMCGSTDMENCLLLGPDSTDIHDLPNVMSIQQDLPSSERRSSTRQIKTMLASVATSINNMTYLKQRSGRASAHETMASYMKALQLKREILGHDHLSVGKTLNNIGSVFYLQREYSPALAAYQDAYRIMSNALGDDNLDVAIVLSNIGDVYCCLCDHVRALEHYRRALKVRWKLLGPSDPRVIRVMEQAAMLELKLANRGLAQPIGLEGSESDDEEYLLEDRRKQIQYLEDVFALKSSVQQDLDFFDWMEQKATTDFVHDNAIVYQEIRDLYDNSSSERIGSTYCNEFMLQQRPDFIYTLDEVEIQKPTLEEVPSKGLNEITNGTNTDHFVYANTDGDQTGLTEEVSKGTANNSYSVNEISSSSITVETGNEFLGTKSLVSQDRTDDGWELGTKSFVSQDRTDDAWESLNNEANMQSEDGAVISHPPINSNSQSYSSCSTQRALLDQIRSIKSLSIEERANVVSLLRSVVSHIREIKDDDHSSLPEESITTQTHTPENNIVLDVQDGGIARPSCSTNFSESCTSDRPFSAEQSSSRKHSDLDDVSIDYTIENPQEHSYDEDESELTITEDTDENESKVLTSGSMLPALPITSLYNASQEERQRALRLVRERLAAIRGERNNRSATTPIRSRSYMEPTLSSAAKTRTITADSKSRANVSDGSSPSRNSPERISSPNSKRATVANSNITNST